MIKKPFYLLIIILFKSMFVYSTDTTTNVNSFIINKNDCPENQLGLKSFNFNITTKIYKDTIGLKLPTNQDNLDTLKQRAQKYANQKSTCLQYYYNDLFQKTLPKNNCNKDSLGRAYNYIVPIKKYLNIFNNDSANKLALKDINDSTQIKANIYGVCVAKIKYIITEYKIVKKTCQLNNNIIDYPTKGMIYTYTPRCNVTPMFVDSTILSNKQIEIK